MRDTQSAASRTDMVPNAYSSALETSDSLTISERPSPITTTISPFGGVRGSSRKVRQRSAPDLLEFLGQFATEGRGVGRPSCRPHPPASRRSGGEIRKDERRLVPASASSARRARPRRWAGSRQRGTGRWAGPPGSARSLRPKRRVRRSPRSPPRPRARDRSPDPRSSACPPRTRRQPATLLQAAISRGRTAAPLCS